MYNFYLNKKIKYLCLYKKNKSISYIMQIKHKHNKYNIDINTERNFWMNNIINNWIRIDYKCPNCKQISLKLKK